MRITRESKTKLERLIEEVTGLEDWEYLDGPDSRCGVDYWLAKGKHEVYANNDQGWVSISLDGELAWEGMLDEWTPLKQPHRKKGKSITKSKSSSRTCVRGVRR